VQTVTDEKGEAMADLSALDAANEALQADAHETLKGYAQAATDALHALNDSTPPPDPSPPDDGLGSVHGRWFRDDSFWNALIPANPEIDRNSKTMIDTLVSMVDGAYTDANEWSTPVYYSDESTPIVDVTIMRDPAHPTMKQRYQQGWKPAPDGSDAHLAVIEPDGTYTEYQGFQILANGKYQCHGGSRGSVTNGDGSSPPDAIAVLPTIGGLIRQQDVDAGELPYGLRCAMPAGSPEWYYPARHSDGKVNGGIPSGGCLWFPEVPTGFDDWTTLCCTAIHKRGLWNGDSNGTTRSISLKAQSKIDGSSYSIPITTIPLDALRQLVVLAPIAA
jgi:hypothetical protein